MELDLCIELDTELFTESLGVFPDLEQDTIDTDGEATTASLVDTPTITNGRYNLRRTSIDNRVTTERMRRTKRGPKPKATPAPLSKYRRRTANGRERDRMSEMNVAFETLRQAMPAENPVYHASCEKNATKITTLRFAMRYINEMRMILGHEDLMTSSSSSSSSSGSVSGNEHCFSPTHSVAESLDSGDSGLGRGTSLSPIVDDSVVNSVADFTLSIHDGWR